FAAGSGNTTADVSLSAAYSYLLAKGLPRVMLPVSLLPPTETPVISSPPPAFTGPVADSIDGYREEQNPTTEGKPQVNFYLSIFGMAGAKQPLIVVDDLFSPVKE